MILPLLVSYLAAGLLAYAGYLAYAQREWSALNQPIWRGISENHNGALAAGFCGWLGLAVVAVETEWFKHGLKWR